MLKIGDSLPEVCLKDQFGKKVCLMEFKRAGIPSVVFFYPKDDTRVCTKEACMFRDNYVELQEHGAVVIGISKDNTSSHVRFAAKFSLPYQLLSDGKGVARKAFGVPRYLFVLSSRVTFVADGHGTIVEVIEDQLNAQAHVQRALEALKKIVDPSNHPPSDGSH